MKTANRGGAPVSKLAVAAILLVSMAGYVSALSGAFQAPRVWQALTDSFHSDDVAGMRAEEAPAALPLQSAARTAPAWLLNALPGYTASQARAREAWYFALDQSRDRLGFELGGSMSSFSSSGYGVFNASSLADLSPSAGFAFLKTSASSGSALGGGPLAPNAINANGTWIFNTNSSAALWSNAANWSGGVIADGGGIANFSTLNITGARNPVIDTTSRTVGQLDIGDTNNTHSYTISATGGGTLIFDNTANAANAQLNATAGSLNDTISAPIVLNSSLDITNASVNNLTLSGGISANTVGTKTITTSTGTVIVSGAITNGTGTVAVTQNGPGNLSLTNAANTYSGDTTITGGRITLDADSEPGTGTLNLAGGTLATSVGRASSQAVTNNIVVTADSSIVTTSSATAVDLNFSGTLSGTAGTLTINNTGGDAATDVFSVRFSGGDFTMARPIVLTGTTGTSQLNDFNTTGTTHTYNGVISGSGSYNRSASTVGTGGTTVFTANNTYTGTTVVNVGTLEIANTNSASSGRISGTSTITANSSGTLLLSGSSSFTDRINDSATMTLNSGKFDTGGLSEHGANANDAGIGALTLQTSSIIDLGSGASILAFANSSANTWTGTLSIYNWSGTVVAGGGTDQLYFGNDDTGLTPAQLAQISFYSDSGTTFLGFGSWASDLTGEVVPTAIPEPSTWIGAALALAAIGFTQRRRFAKR